MRSKSWAVFDRISAGIMSGKLEEGYVFPNEVEFCRQMNVGRSTLREAYRMLELYGFITRNRNGTIVNRKQDILVSLPVRQVFHFAEREELIQFRAMVEGECAYYAARRAKDADIAALSSLAVHLQQNRTDPKVYVQLSRTFHLRLSELSGNSLLCRFARELLEVWQERYCDVLDDKRLRKGAISGEADGFTEITGAMQEKDAEGARRAMIRQIQREAKQYGENRIYRAGDYGQSDGNEFNSEWTAAAGL